MADRMEQTITYYVNGESEATGDRELTVRQILEHAGFEPVTDYRLSSQNPKQDFGTDYDHPVKVHPNQRFDAVFSGPVQTS